MKRPYRVLVAVAALAAFACSEELTVPSAEPAVLHLPQLLVSNTVVSSAVAGAGGSVSSAAVAGGADVTYVSLPPGTLPEMVSVRIRNSDTGEATPSIPMAEGGFDPVAVAASEGHELEFTFTDGEGAVSVAHATVPDRRPPVVVRTNPPRGRTDVVLSILPVVVFSEPIDPETLAAGVRLLGPTGAEVEAIVRLLPNEPWTAELVPASALEPEATYELVVSTEVRDLDGDALEAPHTSEFTTTTATEPSTAPAIAFHSTRDGSYHIYVADADGSNVTRLVEGSYPAWSWDGRRIAFNRSGEWSGELSFCGGVSVVDADGFGVTPLYDWASDGCEVLASGMPAWAPDDRTIAFHGQSPDPGAWIFDTGIFVMNADGSDVRLLLSDTILRPDYSGFGHPTWSPDGQSIALTAAGSEGGLVLFIMGASGSPLRLLSAEGWSGAPAWSPDGSRIAAIHWNLEDPPAIVSYNVSSGDREILFRYPEAQSSGFYEHLDWSPDGRHIVFTMRTTSEPGSGRKTRIFILTLKTGEVRQLIPDAVDPVGDLYADGYPVWSRAVR